MSIDFCAMNYVIMQLGYKFIKKFVFTVTFVFSVWIQFDDYLIGFRGEHIYFENKILSSIACVVNYCESINH